MRAINRELAATYWAVGERRPGGTRRIERFLLELGTDFCFVARQRRLTIDEEGYYIDLVFYHRSLRCLVLVDLKLGAFAPADAAQLQLYLEWAKRHDRREGEEEPIGLILCGGRSEQVVELLLSSQTNRRTPRHSRRGWHRSPPPTSNSTGARSMIRPVAPAPAGKVVAA